MVKVIKDGRVKQVTCLNCNSILEYTDNDVLRKYHSAEVGKYGIYIYIQWMAIYYNMPNLREGCDCST